MITNTMEITQQDRDEIDRHIDEEHGDGERDDCKVCDIDRFLADLGCILSGEEVTI